MVKGVNKTIIEVNQTGSRYFEKILLFVSPEYGDTEAQKLASEADQILRQLDRSHFRRPSLRVMVARRRRYRNLILYGALFAASLALIAVCLLFC